MRIGIHSLLLLVLAMVGQVQAESAAMTDYDPLSPAYLEAIDARIGEVTIENANIFDLDDPKENNLLFRTANRLHIRTLQRIIRRQLLFKPGDLYSQRLADESARILRSNNYLADAQITPQHYADGTVDILVHTTDVWTLKPRLDFGRNGGKNTGTIGFEESNLLGTGISLSLLHESDIDRESNRIEYRDRELGNTRYGLLAAYSDSDEGSGYQFDLGLPFYALDSRRSHGLAVLNDERTDSLYDRGDPQAEFGHQEDSYRLYAGFSSGLHAGWVKRYSGGLGFEEDRFSPGGDATLPAAGILPTDRKFVYPFLAVELLQDEFSVLKNHDQIGRVEDVFHGTRLNLQLGYASTGLGSLDSAVLLDAGAHKGFGEPGVDSLFTSADLSTRWQDGEAQNLLLKTAASWYHRHSPRRLLYSSLNADIGSNLDLDNLIYLGGDNGLRGYPLRYQGGDSSMLFTVEERYFTNWYPFRLFRIGGAVFFDAGRTWGDNPVGAANLGWLKDAGFGLRIGNNRNGSGRVIHVDLAFPLDGDNSIDSVQFLVEAKGSF
ncbi:MAG: BamA/TamA family outer membrane protein [Gammaproteobacteria bacterium]